MTPVEKRSVLSLAMLYATRMLGLFMVLPVFMLYGEHLQGATPALLGLALGAYGLSQAVLQVPFGALSDRFGRKPLIIAGLLIFAGGSILAATAEHIYGVILGRVLQGAGAIASVLMALLSDLTSEESRTKAMALVGMSIGLSFTLALILGPLLGELWGLAGIFWFTAAMAVFGLYWVIRHVPEPARLTRNRDTRLFVDQVRDVLRERDLVRLDAGIFCLHLVLTAMFVAVPVSLVNEAGVGAPSHWWFYLSVMLLSFLAMVPFIVLAEKRHVLKQVFLGALVLLGLSAMSMTMTRHQALASWLSLFGFFMAFNFLEASLPSLVSKLAPAGSRGTAMGVYSTGQFLGAFVGGVSGGWVLSLHGLVGVYVLVGVVVALWGVLAWGMHNPTTKGVTVGYARSADAAEIDALRESLLALDGVEEVVILPQEKIIHLKVKLLGYDEAGAESALAHLK